MIINNLIVYAVKNEYGEYWDDEFHRFTPHLYMAAFFKTMSAVLAAKRFYKLKSCKIIKVRIDEVEDEYVGD